MSRSVNLYLAQVQAVLSNHSLPHIYINQSGAIHRTHIKPTDHKLHDLFLNLIKHISHWIEKHPTHSCKDLATRVKLLHSIDEETKQIVTAFQESCNSLGSILTSFISTSYADENESSLRRIVSLQAQLNAIIERSMSKAESQYKTSLDQANAMLKSPSDSPFPATEEGNLIETTTLAFELAADPDNTAWAEKHKEQLLDLYRQVLTDVWTQKYKFCDILSLAEAADGCKELLGVDNTQVTFINESNPSDTMQINSLLFAAKSNLLFEIIEKDVSNSQEKTYTLSAETYSDIKCAIQHLSTKNIENFGKLSTAQILRLFGYKYFQNSRSFFEKGFEILNGRKLGVRLNNLRNGMQLELQTSRESAQQILQCPIIQASTTHLMISGCKGLFSCSDPKEIDYLQEIFNSFNNLEKLTLPLICAITPETIESLKGHPTLTELELDCTRCDSYSRFQRESLPFNAVFNELPWRVALTNTAHLARMNLIQILTHFPTSRKLAFTSRDWIDDRSLQTTCESLPHLEEISFSDCHAITDTGLQAVADYIKQLTSFSINKCNSISSNGIEAIINKYGEHLRHLDLGDSRIEPNGLLLISWKCPKLEWLCFKGCPYVDDDLIKDILTACKNIKYLDLSGCNISDATLLHIATYCENIETLKINQCSRISVKTLEFLINSRPTLKTIERLGTSTVSELLLKLTKDHAQLTLI